MDNRGVCLRVGLCLDGVWERTGRGGPRMKTFTKWAQETARKRLTRWLNKLAGRLFIKSGAHRKLARERKEKPGRQETRRCVANVLFLYAEIRRRASIMKWVALRGGLRLRFPSKVRHPTFFFACDRDEESSANGVPRVVRASTGFGNRPVSGFLKPLIVVWMTSILDGD